MDAKQLAGAVDSGCISINKRHRSDRKNPEYQLVVVISSKEFAFLDALRGRSGDLGRVYLQQKAEGNRAAGWQWRIADRQAEALLSGAAPHLLKKRMQAETALSFRALMGNRNTLDERERCYQTIKRMNR